MAQASRALGMTLGESFVCVCVYANTQHLHGGGKDILGHLEAVMLARLLHKPKTL
jgi:hypothetical protein